jgi:vanillate O-demethylase monooxygenase subunit
MFLQNAWYVAAEDSEVTREPAAVRVLGERIALYRTTDGEPVALENACPHRKLPLSMGRVRDDELECGYHGLRFNRLGECTRIPGSRNLSRAVHVRRYPAVSRYGLVWIWMGEPDRADPDRIVPVEHLEEPHWARNRGGAMSVDCHYLYITDNLLDPSHVAWVHPTSFGNDAGENSAIDVTESPVGVLASRWSYDVEVPAFYQQLVPFKGRCDRLQHYEVRFPCQAVIKAVFVPAGTGGPGRPIPEQALLMDSYNFLTPVDENRTRYYWFQTRNCHAGDEAISRAMDEGVRAAFAEDRLVLAAVHESFAASPTPNIDLASDRAPLLFRRRLQTLIEADRAK